MPFVEIIWKPDHLSGPALSHLCDRLPTIVAEALTRHDPSHLVTPEMVDLRVSPVGLHDRINPDLYVTVLARTEPARDTHKVEIVDEIFHAVRRFDPPDDTLVELVLTNRVSLYEYGDG
jgi:hypothetical protein